MVGVEVEVEVVVGVEVVVVVGVEVVVVVGVGGDTVSAWNHAICDECWTRRCEERNEVGRVPVRVKENDPVSCCYCGEPTKSGIYVREHPSSDALVCENRHE